MFRALKKLSPNFCLRQCSRNISNATPLHQSSANKLPLAAVLLSVAVSLGVAHNEKKSSYCGEVITLQDYLFNDLYRHLTPDQVQVTKNQKNLVVAKVYPESAEDILFIVKLCQRYQFPLVGDEAVTKGIQIDFSRMIAAEIEEDNVVL